MKIAAAHGSFRCRAGRFIWIVASLGLLLGSNTALAANDDDDRDGPFFCSATASRQLTACEREVVGDFFIEEAICINLTDQDERTQCFIDAKAARSEGSQLCREQRDARRDLCGALGEDRYDPDFDTAAFDDDFTTLTTPNLYFPLTIGNRWDYRGGDETIRVEVLAKTKLIEGVTCIVVNDLVEQDGQPIEDTDDWYAQALNGDVWYCGEIAKNLETFVGDDPQEPELVDIEGSWKAGRDGDKPGIIFLSLPSVGDAYRQEWSPGNAEDAAVVLSTTYGFGGDPELDQFVPQNLAGLLCNADCVVTGESTPIEPDVFERKYYAPGIGLFLEVDPESGDIVQLVSCNVDPRCATLPAPMGPAPND
jgi:hypothetical protein